LGTVCGRVPGMEQLDELELLMEQSFGEEEEAPQAEL
jgi:hypothetical protein